MVDKSVHENLTEHVLWLKTNINVSISCNLRVHDMDMNKLLFLLTNSVTYQLAIRLLWYTDITPN